MSGIALIFQKFLHGNNSLLNFPSHSLIPKPKFNTWGHDQAKGENKEKIHDRAGSMILSKKKCWTKLVTLEIKRWRTKKYDDIKYFLGVKITRDDSSKQERKSHRSSLPTL